MESRPLIPFNQIQCGAARLYLAGTVQMPEEVLPQTLCIERDGMVYKPGNQTTFVFIPNGEKQAYLIGETGVAIAGFAGKNYAVSQVLDGDGASVITFCSITEMQFINR